MPACTCTHSKTNLRGSKAPGSRPASRKASQKIEDLRAIPWVFSWTQNRHGLPGWFGFGSAVAEYVGAHPNDPDSRWDTLRAMYREWPFFQAMIDNAALALAKADSFIASRYAGLVESDDVRHRIGTMIQHQRDQAEGAILSLTGNLHLLSNSPWLQASIDARNPYIDPLNLIQIEWIQRRRNLPAEDGERIRELLRLTVQGIAAGMRTTG